MRVGDTNAAALIRGAGKGSVATQFAMMAFKKANNINKEGVQTLLKSVPLPKPLKTSNNINILA